MNERKRICDSKQYLKVTQSRSDNYAYTNELQSILVKVFMYDVQDLRTAISPTSITSLLCIGPILSETRPSVVCLSPVTFVPPTQAVEIFRNLSSHFVHQPSAVLRAKFYRDPPSETLPSVVKRKRASQVQRCWTYRRLSSHLKTGARYDLGYN